MSDMKTKLEASRLQIIKLERSVLEKSMQLDEERATHTRLVALLESNAYDLISKNKQLTEYANTVTSMLKQKRCLQNTVSILKDQLRRKDTKLKCLDCRMQHESADKQSKFAEQHEDIHGDGKLPTLCRDSVTQDCCFKLNTKIGSGSTDKQGSSEHAFDTTITTDLQTNKLAPLSRCHIVHNIHGNGLIDEDSNYKSSNSSEAWSTHPSTTVISHSAGQVTATQFRPNRNQVPSKWIDTRAHKLHKGPDPHDDFLDTPFDNIMDGLIKQKRVEDEEAATNIPNSIHIIPTDAVQLMPLVSPVVRSTKSSGKFNFKYVDTVRKKRERENLKGIECNLCKKFYDAVLPEDERRNLSTNGVVLCEHHQGVSKHRYKHIPPMTPEGFWDIGFDTET